jgi:hypothetical protein
MFPYPHERLLNDITRILVVVQNPKSEGEDILLVSFDQFPKCSSLTPETPADEFGRAGRFWTSRLSGWVHVFAGWVGSLQMIRRTVYPG